MGVFEFDMTVMQFLATHVCMARARPNQNVKSNVILIKLQEIQSKHHTYESTSTFLAPLPFLDFPIAPSLTRWNMYCLKTVIFLCSVCSVCCPLCDVFRALQNHTCLRRGQLKRSNMTILFPGKFHHVVPNFLHAFRPRQNYFIKARSIINFQSSHGLKRNAKIVNCVCVNFRCQTNVDCLRNVTEWTAWVEHF